MRAASRTVRVSGPALSSENERPIIAWRLTRVWVGLIPTRPLAAAGRRTEPPVSDPSAPKTSRAATEDPEPLDDPPEMCAGFQGLRHAPKCALWPVGPCANSERLSPPMSRAPAASSRRSTVAVRSGTKSRRIFEPQVHTTPAR